MSIQTAEMTAADTLQRMLRIIPALPERSIKKLADYVEELIEEEEDAEDIAYIEAHRDDSVVPLSEIIKDYEVRHGPFLQRGCIQSCALSYRKTNEVMQKRCGSA